MRKISETAYYNFITNHKFSSKNTKVEVDGDEARLLLHGNCIAKKVDGEVFINHCGWETNTTRDRLNAFPGVHIRIFKGDFILNEMGYMNKGWWNVKTMEHEKG